jgi:hypothetical protein
VGRFISADTYTFAADDPRLLWLAAPAEARRKLRERRLRIWQGQSAQRNRYIYALNNPLTYVDRDGHSAGLYVLYTLLSLFWALPYTLVGFLFFELWLNWISFAWLWDKSYTVSGESSDRLGAWAWWSTGGLAGRMIIGDGAFTLGNVVISNATTMGKLNTTDRTWGIPTHHSELAATTVDTSKLLTERESAIEHELRHTNQYGWFGPFWIPGVLVLFLLFQNLVLTGVSVLTKAELNVRWKDIKDALSDKLLLKLLIGIPPMLGVYFWDLILQGGYPNSSFEQNAAQHSGVAFGQNVRALASQESVAPGGTAIVSVITGNGPMFTGASRVHNMV